MEGGGEDNGGGGEKSCASIGGGEDNGGGGLSDLIELLFAEAVDEDGELKKVKVKCLRDKSLGISLVELILLNLR